MNDCIGTRTDRESTETRRVASVAEGERLRWCECPLAVQDVDDAVMQVFELMVGVSCSPVERESAATERVVAEIAIMGAREGRCAVELPAEAGDWLTDSLMGSDADWDDEMIHDAVGELCNMITGGVKRRLGRWLGECSISLPEVSRRRANELPSPIDGEMRRHYRVGEMTVSVTVSFYSTF